MKHALITLATFIAFFSMNSTATFINENLNALFLNGCGDSWLDGYRGPIQVSVNANDGCASTNNTPNLRPGEF
jgi:hypothetical protein